MKTLFATLLAALGLAKPADDEDAPSTFFVFAKIQDSVLPIERGEKYEDPLDAALKARNLGEVTGGGTQLGTGNGVAWVGVDMELVDLDEALSFAKSTLHALGAPSGSVLQYEKDGRDVIVAISE